MDPASRELLWRRASLAERAGDDVAAMRAYCTLVTTLIEDNEPVPPYLLERGAASCARVDAYEPAVHLLGLMRKQAREVGDAHGYVHATLRLADVSVDAADLGGAAAALAELDALTGLSQEALESDVAGTLRRVRIPGESADRVRALQWEASTVLGRWFAAVGRYGASLDALDFARDLWKKSDELMERRWSRFDLDLLRAEVAWEGGHLALAHGICLALHGDPSADARQRARLCVVRARLARARGDLREAKRLLFEALADGSDVALTCQAALDLCVTCAWLNRVPEAEDVVTGALERLAARGDRAADRMRVALNEALSFARGRRVSTEMAAEFDALTREPCLLGEGDGDDRLRRSPRLHDDWGRAANRLLATLGADHERGSAEAAMARLVDLTNDTDSELLIAQTLWLDGLRLFRGGDLAGAQERLMEARARSTHIGAMLDAWRCAVALAWVSLRSGDLELGERRTREAREALRALTADLDREDALWFMLDKWTGEDDRLEAEIRRISGLREPNIPWRPLREGLHRWRVGRATRALFVGLLADVGWDSWLNSSRESTVPPPAAPRLVERSADIRVAAQIAVARRNRPRRWRRSLPRAKEVAGVHLHPLRESMVAFVVTAEGVRMLRSSTTKVRVAEAVREAREAVHEHFRSVARTDARGARTRRASERMRGALGALAEITMLPAIAEALGDRVNHCVVCAQDVLVAAPFAALPLPDGRPWGTCHALTALPSWSWWAGVRGGGRLVPSSKVTIAGRTTFPGTSLPDLPYAGRECGLLSEALLGTCEVETLLDSRVTREALRRAFDEGRHVHIATHGTFDAREPHESGVHTAGADGGNALWTVAQIQQERFAAGATVVLSSCESSASVALPGRELVGVPAALLRAGAARVVAPLWKVTDDLTTSFMLDLYRVAQETTLAEALRRVRAAWAGDEDSVRAAPYVWAPWVHFGE